MSKATCYYDILEVDKEAGDSELKKAYRKLALQLHPDKHSEEDRDEATRKFALLQHAYEVLSDPQERAWYDSHRDSILSNSSKSSTPGDGGLSTDDIKIYFSRGVYSNFDDSDKGFFTIFRKLFQSLAKNEECDLVPQFGSSEQDYIEDEVKTFYDFWLSFSSTRSFSWHDIYKPSDAPDRRIRRLMEKDNAKLRELARKEFNSTLRCLVEYLQKRDPRYKKYMEERSAEKEKAKQKRIADQKLKKANSSKSASNFQLPSWAQVDEEELEEIENLNDWSYTNVANPSTNNDGSAEDGSASEMIEGLDLYCPACDKFFETPKQQQHHNETKKHLKMIERLRAELLEEEKDIYSDFVNNDSFADSKKDYSISQQTTELPNSSDFLDDLDDKNELIDSSITCELDDLHLYEFSSTKKTKKQKQKKKNVINTFHLLEEQEDPSLLQHLDKHDSKKSPQNTNDIDCLYILEDISQNSSSAPFGTFDPEGQDTANILKKTKREKRKAKKNKASANQSSCNVCNEIFDTRNQLFSHIRVTGHAQAS